MKKRREKEKLQLSLGYLFSGYIQYVLFGQIVVMAAGLGEDHTLQIGITL
jgi:hypothetical protein